MGMPVKLSDDLVRLAREEADTAQRSITAQIEHWATLGRATEAVLRHEDARALKNADGDLSGAFPQPATRRTIHRLLQGVAASKDRADLARALQSGRVVYEADPAHPEQIVQIAPDGGRRAGRIENRRFVPERERRAGASK
jgi:hypothetical protein